VLPGRSVSRSSCLCQRKKKLRSVNEGASRSVSAWRVRPARSRSACHPFYDEEEAWVTENTTREGYRAVGEHFG
jgi:hypothetical protein